MSLEELVQIYKELALQIAELELKKKGLGLAILEQMSGKTASVAGYTVRRYDRLSIKTSLEEARELGATKMEEVLDKDVLKKLHELGHPVPGISPISFIQVSSSKLVLPDPITGEIPT